MENSSSMAVELRQRQSSAVRPNVLMTVFASTLFCSALMLFSVQPMFAKMALPTLGGTPAVWAVSMCFFQTALLAGYCYAHALNRYLDAPKAAFVHLTLLALTSFLLPIALPASAANPPEGDAYLWLLGILAMGVGLPFFAVSASAPLLQAWFSKTGHKDASDPYFLYGASNLGSLIALLAYPFAFEPVFGLKAQSTIWGFGFFALTLLIAACAALMLRSRSDNAIEIDQPRVATAQTKISWNDRATWLFLAAIPSGLLVAVTTYITTDVASAPFIWVMPLAMFLLTFILVFKDKLPFNYGVAQNLLIVSIALHIFFELKFLFIARAGGPAFAVLAFFLASVLCHRELYLRRPNIQNLTEFYIWMSAGGVLGGVFSALIAPQIFVSVIEFKLLILLSLLCRPDTLLGLQGIKPLRIVGPALLMIVGYIGFNAIIGTNIQGSDTLGLLGILVLILAALLHVRNWTEYRALIVLALVMIIGITDSLREKGTNYVERSFFGTNRVSTSSDGQHRLMLHGTTLHGSERIKSSTSSSAAVGSAGLYYYEGGPMQRAFALVRQSKPANSALQVGIVGLGTGALACSAKPGDSLRYFEIDPMVGRIAKNPNLFTFLSRCAANSDIVYGDARLKLLDEQDYRFDYLLIDAFSSDAIPIHLITREALEMYLNKLAPDGLLAIHISNDFLNLEPSLSATLGGFGSFKSLRVSVEPTHLTRPDAATLSVVFVSKNQGIIDSITKEWSEARPLIRDNTAPWTDDYSDILSALFR